MTSGGLRTSVKGYLIAQRVTVVPEINTVHDDEMSIYAISNSTAAESMEHPPDPLSIPYTSISYWLNICAAKGMASYGSYGARTKSESPPHIENENLQSFHLRSFQYNELKAATTNIMAQGGLGSVYKGWIDAHSVRAAKPGTGIAVVIKRLSQQRTLQRHKDWLNYNVKLHGYGVAVKRCDGYRHSAHDFQHEYDDFQHECEERYPVRRSEYVAPELYCGIGDLTPKCDVYSFGVVMLEMLSGREAVDDDRPTGQRCLVEWVGPYLASKRGVKRFVDTRIDGQYSVAAVLKAANLARGCLSFDPKLRPDMNELLQHWNNSLRFPEMKGET